MQQHEQTSNDALTELAPKYEPTYEYKLMPDEPTPIHKLTHEHMPTPEYKPMHNHKRMPEHQPTSEHKLVPSEPTHMYEPTPSYEPTPERQVELAVLKRLRHALARLEGPWGI